MVARTDKTFPRVQKQWPDSKTRPRIQNTFHTDKQGSITSRCTGYEPAILPPKRDRASHKHYPSTCFGFWRYIKIVRNCATQLIVWMLTVLKYELRGRRPGFSGLKGRGGEYSAKCFVPALLFFSLAAFSPRFTVAPMLLWHSATFTGDVVKSYIPPFSGKQYLYRGLYQTSIKVNFHLAWLASVPRLSSSLISIPKVVIGMRMLVLPSHIVTSSFLTEWMKTLFKRLCC